MIFLLKTAINIYSTYEGHDMYNIYVPVEQKNK